MVKQEPDAFFFDLGSGAMGEGLPVGTSPLMRKGRPQMLKLGNRSATSTVISLEEEISLALSAALMPASLPPMTSR
jgi:hypothetical protein